MTLRLNSPEKMPTVHGAAAQGNGEITLFLGQAGTQKSTWALRCGQLIGDRALSWSNNGLHRLADGCRLHSTTAYPLASIKPFNSGLAENLTLTNKRNPTR